MKVTYLIRKTVAALSVIVVAVTRVCNVDLRQLVIRRSPGQELPYRQVSERGRSLALSIRGSHSFVRRLSRRTHLV